jgi:hypothetical protein
VPFEIEAVLQLAWYVDDRLLFPMAFGYGNIVENISPYITAKGVKVENDLRHGIRDKIDLGSNLMKRLRWNLRLYDLRTVEGLYSLVSQDRKR